jgi:hypothetical protein
MVFERYLPPLTMNDYQANMAQCANFKWKVIYPALGVANEASEVLGKIKKLKSRQKRGVINRSVDNR